MNGPAGGLGGKSAVKHTHAHKGRQRCVCVQLGVFWIYSVHATACAGSESVKRRMFGAGAGGTSIQLCVVLLFCALQPLNHQNLLFEFHYDSGSPMKKWKCCNMKLSLSLTTFFAFVL